MRAALDTAHLSGLAGAALSLLAYVSDPGSAWLAVFGACAAVFVAAAALRARNIYAPRPGGLLLRAESLLRAALRGAALYARRIAPGRRQKKTSAVRVRKEIPGTRIGAILRSRARAVLDVISDADALRRVYGELNPNIVRSVALSGAATDLNRLRKEAGAALVIAGLAAAAGAALAGLAGPAEIGLAMPALPAAVLFYPRIKLRLAAFERKRALVDEMTFFAVYCLLLAEVGKTMVYALASTAGRGVFPALEREAAIMERGRGLGMGKIVALGDLARNHPNPDFGALLGGYVAAFNAGDPKAHLRSQADELLERMRRRMEAYREHGSSLCIMVVFTMFFLPVMMTPVAVIAGSKSAAFLYQISFLIIPLMAAMVCVIAHSVQPKFGSAAGCDWRIPLGLAAGAGAVAGVMEPERAWAPIAAAALAFSASAMALTHRRRMIASSIDRNQGRFFRDITSRINAGDSNILHAIDGAVGPGGVQYDRTFVSILEHARFRIRRAGQTVQDVLADTARESWLGRFSFFLLSRIADTGSVDAWVLTRTTEFVEKFAAVRRDAASSIRAYALAAAASPIGVVAMTWFLKSVLAGASSDIPADYGFGGIGISRPDLVPEFDEAISSLIMVSAICANAAIGKISSMGVSDTRSLLAGTLVALAGILVFPHLPPLEQG